MGVKLVRVYHNNAHTCCIGITTAMAAVIVHGGAYAIPDSIADASVRGCQNAAGLAHRALREGKSAVDAGRNRLSQLIKLYVSVCI